MSEVGDKITKAIAARNAAHDATRESIKSAHSERQIATNVAVARPLNSQPPPQTTTEDTAA